MTAEIAIMNKVGIALAADSKVSISGAGTLKTFDTVNKLFTLSKVHPVGIMIWGNAEFMQYPWEVIIKQFRDSKKNKSEQTVEKWANDFIVYLKTYRSSKKEDIGGNIYGILDSHFEELKSVGRAIARGRGVSSSSSEYSEVLIDYLEYKISEFEYEKLFLNKNQIKPVLVKYLDYIGQAISDNFSTESESLFNKVQEFAVKSLVHEVFSPQSSGFVVAGYGEKEVFPALVEFETDGFVGSHLKITRRNLKCVSPSCASVIYPFAQKEMVQRFMNGVDPNFMDFADTIYTNAMVNNCIEVLNRYGMRKHKVAKVRGQIEQAVNASIDSVHKALADEQTNEYWLPIIGMVKLLPKDELPHLAESLVALTSLKRHVSHDPETVGGPIDVALISKSDGFIWIKRKHYFSAELNPQFSAGYMRGLDGEDHGQNQTVPKSRRAAASRAKSNKGRSSPARSRKK